MRLAIADGADALEFDVRVSADGHVVVIHDATVDRTTDGTGAVERMGLAELRRLDAGSRFRPGASGPVTRVKALIPTLDEVLGSFPGIALIIELKSPLSASPTRQLIEKHGAEGRCLVDSFSSAALSVFRDSRIASGAGRNGIVRLLAGALTRAKSPVPAHVSALAIPRIYHGLPLPVGLIVRTMRSAGKPTHVWTVNEPDEARELWRLGASGMITDSVPTMLAARDRS